MRYRAEVDGLRAIAVLPVLLFHAGFKTFSGGFVGVDIFFVISGYLITSIIAADLSDGSFRLRDFYERRARRILPALFLVMLACLPLAWCLLVPKDMQDFAQSLVAVAVFASNVLFWQTSGYFETSAELKPLLHTWSLSVEEQFYLLYPALLAVVWRLGKRLTPFVLMGLLVASLLLADRLTTGKSTAAFYLLPTRGWELLIGALIAMHGLNHRTQRLSTRVDQLASLSGMVLILLSIFTFDRTTPSPGFYTLAPTLGAGLVILCANAGTVVGRVLATPILVRVGLISYSMYLWHQPLLSFARHGLDNEPGAKMCGLILAIATGLAYLSWRYVELPFRDRRRVSSFRLVGYAGLGAGFFIAFGVIGLLDHGYQHRLSSWQRDLLSEYENSAPDWRYFSRVGWREKFRIECDFYDVEAELQGHPTLQRRDIAPACYTRLGQPRAVLLWGDSHAQHFYHGLRATLPADWQILQVATSGCKPSVDEVKTDSDYCRYSNAFAYRTVVAARPDVVVIGQESGHDAGRLDAIAERLLAAGVRKVVIVGPSPHWRRDGLPSIVARIDGDVPRFTSRGLDASVRAKDERLKSSLVPSSQVRVISQFDHFCRGDACMVYLGDDPRTGLTTYDYGHLSPIASIHFAQTVLSREITTGPP